MRFKIGAFSINIETVDIAKGTFRVTALGFINKSTIMVLAERVEIGKPLFTHTRLEVEITER